MSLAWLECLAWLAVSGGEGNEQPSGKLLQTTGANQMEENTPQNNPKQHTTTSPKKSHTWTLTRSL